MSPWSKKSSRQRTEDRPKSVQSVSARKRKSPGGVIFISDPDLLKKHPWLLACSNIRFDR